MFIYAAISPDFCLNLSQTLNYTPVSEITRRVAR